MRHHRYHTHRSEENDGPRPAGWRFTQLRRMVALLGPYAPRAVFTALALLVGSGLTLVYPKVVELAIDRGLATGSSRYLALVTLVAFGVLLVQAIFTWIRSYHLTWLGERVVTDLRKHVFGRLLTLPPTWYHQRRGGEIVGRLSHDVAVMNTVVSYTLGMALRNLLTIVGGVTLLFIVNPRLTLITMAILPPLVLLAVFFGRKLRLERRRVHDRLADASAQLSEAAGAMDTVQAFVREAHEHRRYGSDVEEAFEAQRRLAIWSATFTSAVSAGMFGIIIALLWVGGGAVIGGEMSGGALAGFLLYTMFVGSAIGSLAEIYGGLQQAAGATERVFAILDTEPEIRDPEHPAPLPAGGGHIRFEDLSFRYASRPEQPVLQGIELEIQPGEVVALVGPSGAGKSTLAAMIQRFYDPDAGRVTFDGVDLRQLRLADLRGATASVTQEPVLFSGTIRDNIAYGREGAEQAAIEQAARDANAHDFVVAFPDGYATKVGERGVKLSVGQKQRIAIARAVLADPRILILDEATSSLDAESESLVQEALTRLMQGRTTIVIAHRLSTVRDADRIIVLERGRIVERGDHDELMTHAGTYRRLVERQLIG